MWARRLMLFFPGKWKRHEKSSGSKNLEGREGRIAALLLASTSHLWHPIPSFNIIKGFSAHAGSPIAARSAEMRIPHFCSGSPLDPPRIPTGSPADPQALRRSCQADSRVAPVDFVSYAQLFLPHRTPKLAGEHITICRTLQSDMLKRKVCQPPLSRNNVLKKVWNSKVGNENRLWNKWNSKAALRLEARKASKMHGILRLEVPELQRMDQNTQNGTEYWEWPRIV